MLVLEVQKYARMVKSGFRADTMCVFLLPGTERKICQSALARVIGFEREAWKTVRKFMEQNRSLSHGLEGTASNNKLDFFRDCNRE